jgi:hypothetical protein
MSADLPVAGQVFRVGAEASIQFQGRELTFRVIRVDNRPTYQGWLWLDGYVLDALGNAVDRRTIFVRRAGLRGC